MVDIKNIKKNIEENQNINDIIESKLDKLYVDKNKLNVEKKLTSYWVAEKKSDDDKPPPLVSVSSGITDVYYKYNKTKINVWKVWKLNKERKQINDFIWCHERVINCILKLNTVFLMRVGESQCSTYAKFTKNHIDRLQYQCNQLIYRKQHIEFSISFWTAIIALIISIISIFLVVKERVIHYPPPHEKTEYCRPEGTTFPINECIDDSLDTKIDNQVDESTSNNNNDSIK